MSSYFALWRAILHVPFRRYPFKTSYTRCLTCNALYVIVTPYTRCHPCNALYVIASAAWQSPGRAPCYKTHARYFCTCVEKRRTQAKEWALLLAIMWFQKHSVRRDSINCLMELSRLNVIELTNLALSVATILTRDLTVSETECLLKFLCIVRDDISLILCDKRNDK